VCVGVSIFQIQYTYGMEEERCRCSSTDTNAAPCAAHDARRPLRSLVRTSARRLVGGVSFRKKAEAQWLLLQATRTRRSSTRGA